MPNSDISCGTLRQEYQFLFGSCRDFFPARQFLVGSDLQSKFVIHFHSGHVGAVGPRSRLVNAMSL